VLFAEALYTKIYSN